MEILSAHRIPPHNLFPKKRLQEKYKIGLRYENKVVKVLKKLDYKIEHNPWFEYKAVDSEKNGLCSPDVILHQGDFLIVIEIKYTYTPEALEKLNRLYCPVVKKALGRDAYPLVVFKNLIPNIRFEILSFWETIRSPVPVYQWLGNGPLT